MNRSKSLIEYFNAILMCLNDKNKSYLFLGNKANDINNISDLLINKNIGFKLNKTKSTIYLNNGSKMYFKDYEDGKYLGGLEFNYISIHGECFKNEPIKQRQR
tara:strand:+ start:89 stop:397 length:309 start_codon:yes stop_codon:yes gene_type:complete